MSQREMILSNKVKHHFVHQKMNKCFGEMRKHFNVSEISLALVNFPFSSLIIASNKKSVDREKSATLNFALYRRKARATPAHSGGAR